MTLDSPGTGDGSSRHREALLAFLGGDGQPGGSWDPLTGAGDVRAEAARRQLAVDLGDGERLVLRLASDGLDLTGKLALERALSAEFRHRGLGVVTVFFQRREPAAVEVGSAPAVGAGPVPVARARGPFGLQFNRRAIPGVTTVIAVASGKGGVGKSTVSVNLAVALARRLGVHAASGAPRVGLLDADLQGPSAHLMLGTFGPMTVGDGDLLVPRVAHGVKVASFGFLTDADQPTMWRGPLMTKALSQLCHGVAWGDLDVLILDLPPGTGDVHLSLIETVPLHGAVVVTTPQDVALIDARKALAMFDRLGVRVLGLVENMAGHRCTACGHVDDVFGAGATGGAEALAMPRGAPLLARIPLDARVRASGDDGRPLTADQEGAKGDGALTKLFDDLAAAIVAGNDHTARVED